MIHRDPGDHGDLGRDDVRRIESTTKASLDERDINRLVGEVLEGHRGQHLEVGGFLLDGFGGLGDRLHQCGEGRTVDDLSTDTNAFPEFDQVR